MRIYFNCKHEEGKFHTKNLIWRFDFKGSEETISDFNDTITEGGVSRALQKYKCNAKSFDNAGFHSSMLSRLGANAILALTHLYNGFLETGSWVWRAAKIIFLRKEGKTSYARSGTYRPISITLGMC